MLRAYSKFLSPDASPAYKAVPLDDTDAAPPTWRAHSRRREWFCRGLYLIFGGLVGAIICGSIVSSILLHRFYNPVGHYQDINPFPVVANSTPKPESRAIVTALYTDDFALSVATLGQSLTALNITERRIVIYIAAHLSPRALCIVAAAGWEAVAVPRIPPPHAGAGVLPHWIDQFTKLNIWGLDALGVDVLLYLDGDALVLSRFDELWALPYAFAAVPDVYRGREGFTLGFNAAVLLVRPARAVLADMRAQLETADFRATEAEQAFLNVYWAPHALRLPYIYNGNLAIKAVAPRVWAALQPELRVVHYTVVKPGAFLSDAPGVPWRENWDASIAWAAEVEGGAYREEIGWWADAWHDLMDQKFDTLDICS
ncbi:glycosyltransferase family 8 protein [Mycena pura]|uniref:Glycosyltransferase family 8 protein n=1 Tax=Mycena pura TaxID=153505 RepID=A0AAD6XYZ8_9AGAR|nr:glycosyltransferase family 8 protein [Mycena pura]